MDNRPIGVFDSGVGGLSVVRELRRVLPNENIIYFGDTGRVPYGTRSRETIRKYAAQDIALLLSHGVKAIVAACGTVSTNFSDADVVQMGVSVPYRGVVAPASQAACEQSTGGRIGVIATPASIRTGAYKRTVHALRPQAQVLEQACPLLVPLVENAMVDFGNQITRLTLQMYLEPLMREEIDTLILGCTHFPLLYDIIDDLLEHRVTLIDAGAETARCVRDLLKAQGLQTQRQSPGGMQYYVSDRIDGFLQIAQLFLGEDVRGCVEYVDITTITENR